MEEGNETTQNLWGSNLDVDHDQGTKDNQNSIDPNVSGDNPEISSITDSTISTGLSLEDAKEEAKTQCIRLFESWNALKKLLGDGHNEVQLQKRCRKLGSKQRRELFSKAWPGIIGEFGGHFESYRDDAAQEKTRFLNVYAWPSITPRCLGRWYHFSLFLYARGDNPPQDFVLADLQGPAASGWTCADARARSTGYYMPLKGRSAEEYARVTTVRQDNIEYGDALDVLEVQNEILRFLVQCATYILKDRANSSMINDPVFERALYKKTSAYFSPSFYSYFAMTAPYTVPNPARLEKILDMRTRDARNHLLKLRTHPGYFYKTVQDHNDHSYDRICEENNSAPDLVGDVDFWQRVVVEGIGNAYRDIFYWLELSTLLKAFCKVDQDDSDHRDRLEGGNPELLSICRKISHFLDRTMIPYQIKKARCFFAASPSMRRYFGRHSEQSGLIVSRKIITREQQFSGVFSDSGFSHLFKMFARIPDEIPRNGSLEKQRIMQVCRQLAEWATSDDNLKLSPMVFLAFSDLGYAVELQNQLSVYRYANLKVANLVVNGNWNEVLASNGYIQNRVDTLQNAQMPVQHIKTYLSRWRKTQSAKMPYTGANGYEIRKPLSRAETKVMQHAEDDLVMFWNDFDTGLQAETSGGTLSAIQDLRQFQDRPHRTPDWVEPEGANPSKPVIVSGSKQKGKVEKAKEKEQGRGRERKSQATAEVDAPKKQDMQGGKGFARSRK